MSILMHARALRQSIESACYHKCIMEFDPKQRDRIVAEATKLRDLLRHVHEAHWEAVVDRGIWLLQEDRFLEGVECLKAMYGGMGSINDIYISPVNNHDVTSDDASSFNHRLAERLTSLYHLINP